MSEKIGQFKHYSANKSSFMRVMNQHLQAAEKINKSLLPGNLAKYSVVLWEEVISRGRQFGFRNAQTTVLAPTGTIGFMMDCDTTGIEPDIALVKYKKLVGGGMIKIVNNTLPLALKNLNYNEEEIELIKNYIDANDTIEGAPNLKTEHIAVFDCAFKPINGTRMIHYLGHIDMLAAVQPFISGGISKTINLPTDVKVAEIEEAYMLSWKKGIKAVAMYRDGSKRIQPLNLKADADKKSMQKEKQEIFKPHRHRLPDERPSLTHKFIVAGHEGYLTVGLYPDGKPGELFIRMSKLGSFVSGLMDAIATATSIMLQYGVPLDVLVNKFAYAKFDPHGITNNPQIRFAKSIIDYIFRYLAIKFLNKKELISGGEANDNGDADMFAIEKAKEFAGQKDMTRDIPFEGIHQVDTQKLGNETETEKYEKNLYEDTKTKIFSEERGNKESNEFLADKQSDAPPCYSCGATMIRNGSCYKCLNCGATSGCS